MKILLVGGTGAMGSALSKIFSETDNIVHITSRKSHDNEKNITYVLGNAMDDVFFLDLIEKERYDVVVDFMVYSTEAFKLRIERILSCVKQYVYLSSSRVYADSTEPIAESFPRLLDVCEEKDYLATKEYALEKARQEDILRESARKNWTIIRPYITYNTERLQLGAFEKEQWLYRALHGKTIVFQKDLMDCITSITSGYDVAYGIYNVILNEKAFGKAIHFVSPYAMKWSDVLDIYLSVLEKLIGKRPKVKLIDNCEPIAQYVNKYQLKYDRLYNRVFDSSLADEIIGDPIGYVTPQEGLEKALSEFVSGDMHFLNISYVFEAKLDRITKDRPHIARIPTFKNKLRYLLYRFIK